MRDDHVPRFARIPAGDFTMGADDGDEDERPAHRVTLAAFHLAAHPVTIEQYARFVRETGHRAPAVRELPRLVPADQEAAFRELAEPYTWRGGEPPADRLRHPVTLVTCADADAYCRWLGDRLGRLVRLPSEAEWERAARGGTEGKPYPWGDELDPARANYLRHPALKKQRGTRPVGSYPANAFDLHDMVGNVWEWVADWYWPDAYQPGRSDRAPGPADSALRVVRGGSWVTSEPAQLRTSHRHTVPPDSYAYSIGFRVAFTGDPIV